LVDLPKWYAVSAAPFSAAYRCVNRLRILTPNWRWVKKFYIDIAHCFC